jgi:hypothetical protein
LGTGCEGSWTRYLTPVDEAVVECASIRCIDGWVGDVLAQRWRVLVQVHDQLREVSCWRRELAHEQFVEARHVHRRLVDGFGHFEDEVVSRRLAE